MGNLKQVRTRYLFFLVLRVGIWHRHSVAHMVKDGLKTSHNVQTPCSTDLSCTAHHSCGIIYLEFVNQEPVDILKKSVSYKMPTKEDKDFTFVLQYTHVFFFVNESVYSLFI